MLTNKIAEAAKERKRKEAEIEKKAKEKAALLALIEEKRIQKERELEEKRYNLEETKRREEEERIEQLKASRTKEYYEFNQQGKRVPPTGAPLYFGENVTDSSGIAWYPHGKGEFFYEMNLLYEGNFVKGLLHGLATWNFKDGISWDGEFSGSDGSKYAVDAGVIGIVSQGLISSDPDSGKDTNGGMVYTFSSDVLVTMEKGVFTFESEGMYLRINTGYEEEEDEDEDEDDEDDEDEDEDE